MTKALELRTKAAVLEAQGCAGHHQSWVGRVEWSQAPRKSVWRTDHRRTWCLLEIFRGLTVGKKIRILHSSY